jgi:protein transport protein SEC24
MEGTGEVPLVDFNEAGPFRCGRCKAYVNSAFQWVQDGRKATCNLCLFSNDVPQHYFCQTNEYGVRTDKDARAELTYGVYDIKAPSSFSSKPPVQPSFVFLIDTSLNAYESGFLHHTISSIKSCLESVVQPEVTSVVIVTYDSAIHFFSLSQDENADPTILNVGDIQNPFVPLPFQKLALNVATDIDRLNNLLDKIYNMYTPEYYSQGRQVVSTCTGAAIKASSQMLEELGKFLNCFKAYLCCLRNHLFRRTHHGLLVIYLVAWCGQSTEPMQAGGVQQLYGRAKDDVPGARLLHEAGN